MVRKLFSLLVLITFITSCSPRSTVSVRTMKARPVEPKAAPLPESAPITEAALPVVIASPVEAAAAAPSFVPVLSPDPALISVPALAPTPVASDHQTQRLPIIEYHYSTFKMGAGVQMQTEWFLSQLAWLHENGFEALTSAQLAAFVRGTYNPPARSVVLTFDVGASKFDDYADIVIPALRQYHLHGVFFILASRTVDSCEDPDQACWPMLKQWADEGIISVGSHSWSHIDYETMAPEEIYRDAAHSKALIEEKTGQAVLGICYPFDSVNPAAFALLQSLGYQWAVGGYTQADRSAQANAVQPYALPRYYPYSGDYYPIIGGTHGQTFDQMMLGAIDQ